MTGWPGAEHGVEYRSAVVVIGSDISHDGDDIATAMDGTLDWARPSILRIGFPAIAAWDRQ